MNKRPTQKQIEFLDWEFGAFFHFGIRTFFPGHRNWDDKPMDASAFNPDRLDCDDWIKTVRDAGARYAILVCKHHDGFANWPTKYSDYSVANSPWKDGKGDVVREFTDACRKYGLKIGLYYSPAQWGGQVAFENGKAYDDYFIHQITELLSNYGKIDYLWFDGCGSENHEYDKKRIIQTIRSLQPEILIFNMWDPDTAWVGNEDGLAPMCNSNRRDAVDFSVMTTEREALGERLYLPAECDCRMRSEWFDCGPGEKSVKTVDELIGMYEMSVGRGANFLLNIGPDRRGQLPAPDKRRVLEFGEEVRRRYGTPCPEFGEMKEENGEWFIQTDEFMGPTWEAHRQPLVNRVILREDLLSGGEVRAFRIYAHLPGYHPNRICVYKGDTIGHKAICTFPAIRTSKLTVSVESGEGDYRLTDMKAYWVK